MIKLWNRLFLEERPSIGLSFFRIAAALSAGFHVIPSFFCLSDNYLKTAFKVLNHNFFPEAFLAWVQKSPDPLVVFFVVVFCAAWFFFLIGFFSQISCIAMTLAAYYFYALNSYAIGTLSWDILLVTLFLMCLTPYHGDYFSLDSLFFGNPDASRRCRPFFIQSLLQMQVAFTYFYTGLNKVTGSGNWLSDNPIYYLMNYPFEGVMKTFLIKNMLAVQPEICYAIGVAVVWMELLMPVLLVWRRTRLAAIYLGALFQLVIFLTMDVPAIFIFLFPAQLLLFIPPEDWIGWIQNQRARNQKHPLFQIIYDGHCRFCRSSVERLKTMDLFETTVFIDYQETEDITRIHPNLTRELAHSQLHGVDLSDLSLSGGFFAFRKLAFHMPMLWPLLPLFYFPGAGLAGPWIYRWISENRYLFHAGQICTHNACFQKRRPEGPKASTDA